MVGDGIPGITASAGAASIPTAGTTTGITVGTALGDSTLGITAPHTTISIMPAEFTVRGLMRSEQVFTATAAAQAPSLAGAQAPPG